MMLDDVWRWVTTVCLFVCKSMQYVYPTVDHVKRLRLHYAALSGEESLIEALLQRRADANARTTKDEPKLGFPPQISPLDITVP